MIILILIYVALGVTAALWAFKFFPKKFEQYSTEETAAGLLIGALIWPGVLLYAFILWLVREHQAKQKKEDE